MQSDLAAVLARRRQSLKQAVEADERDGDDEGDNDEPLFPSSPPQRQPQPQEVEQSGVASDKVFKALFDYHGEAHATDIPLRKDDIVYVLDDTDAGWWRARVGNKEGLVPANFLTPVAQKDEMRETDGNAPSETSNGDGASAQPKPFVLKENRTSSDNNLWDNEGDDSPSNNECDDHNTDADDENEGGSQNAATCSAFALDIRAASFGTCVCGLAKRDHTAEALASGSSGRMNKATPPPVKPPNTNNKPKPFHHSVRAATTIKSSNQGVQRHALARDERLVVDDDDDQTSGACDEFKLDMLAATFGMCKCGHVRGEHSQKAKTVTHVTPAHSTIARPQTQTQPQVQHVPKRTSPKPPAVSMRVAPAVPAAVPVSSPPKPLSSPVRSHERDTDTQCSSFVLDVNAATFGMCKCGHKRGDHSSEALRNTTVTGSGARHALKKTAPAPKLPPANGRGPSNTPTVAAVNSAAAFSPATPSPTPSAAASTSTMPVRADQIGLRKKTLLRAVNDFTAAEDGDLSLKVGETIELIDKIDEGWWKGRRGSEEGIFPAQFVEELSSTNAVIRAKQTRAAPPAPLNLPTPQVDEVPPPLPTSPKPNLSDHLIQPVESPKRRVEPVAAAPKQSSPLPAPPPPPPKTPTVASDKLVRALYDYTSDQTEDLTFHSGDVIQVVDAIDDHWLSGKLGGRVGIFPKQFVEEISDVPSNAVRTTNGPQVRSVPPPRVAAAPRIATALFDFAGGEAGDLAFHKDQQIEVLEVVDDSWLRGRVMGGDDAQVSGIFPRSFVEMVTAPTTQIQTASHSPVGKGSVGAPPPPPPTQAPPPHSHSTKTEYIPLANGLKSGVSHSTLQRVYSETSSAPPAPWYVPGHDTFSSTSRYASFGTGPTTKTEEFQIRRSSDLALVLLTIVQGSNEQVARVTADVRPCRVLTDSELSASAERYGPSIVAFAEQRLGTVVGNGECWTLADEAFRSVPGVSPARGYRFGQVVGLADVMPGDVIQLRECKFVFPNGVKVTAGAPDHTAVVTRKEGMDVLHVLEQNPKPVSRGSYDFRALVSGTFVIYRAYPEALMPSAA